MGSLIMFLIAFPLAAGVLLLAIKNGRLRNVFVVAAAVVVAGGSIATAFTFGNGNSIFFGLPFDLPASLPLSRVLLGAELAIGVFVIAVSIRNRRILAPLLVSGQ